MQFFMKLFLTDEMFRKITKWTKTHMWKYFEDNNDDQGLQTSRNFTKVNDMKKFLDRILLIGLNKKSKLRFYA